MLTKILLLVYLFVASCSAHGLHATALVCTNQSVTNQAKPCHFVQLINTDCCSMETDGEILDLLPNKNNASISFPYSLLLENKLLLNLQYKSMNSMSNLCLRLIFQETMDTPSNTDINVTLQLDTALSQYLIAVRYILKAECMENTLLDNTVSDNLKGRLQMKDTCEENDSDEYDLLMTNMCNRLRAAPTNFRPLQSMRMIEFVLALNETTYFDVVRMSHTSNSSLNCDGSSHPFIVQLNETENIWLNNSEPLLLDVPLGFHCLRIHLHCRNSCVIHTKTIELRREIDNPTKIEKAIIWWMFFGLGITIFFLFATIFFLVYLYQGHFNMSSNSNENLLSYPADTIGSSSLSILLLYSRDSDEFCNVVRTFKELLEEYTQITVYDPFDELLIEEVSRNSEGWLTKMINTAQLKIVIVLSKGAILKQNALHNNNTIVFMNPHCLDNIFTSALNHLHHNPVLSNDYERVFLVRFGKGFSLNLAGVTPHRCFALHDHYQHLISALFGSYNVGNERYGNPQNDFDENNEQLKHKIECFRYYMENMPRTHESNSKYIEHNWRFKTA